VIPTERRPRRVLQIRSSDAPRNSAQAGPVTSTRNEAKAVRRIQNLTARLRAHERASAYFRAVAMGLLAALQDEPVLRDRCTMAAFLAGLEAIAKSDPAVAAALGEAPMQELSPEACASLLTDLEHGPATVARLATDRALAARLAELGPVAQALELGRITGSATARAPSSVLALFGRNA
jgi:hypothetical protein